MELSEFRHRYNDAQNRFNESLQAITVAIEIVAANNLQHCHTINQTLQTISEFVPRVFTDYEELTAVIDEFLNSQQSRNNSPQELGGVQK